MTTHEILHDLILNKPLYSKITYSGNFLRTNLPDMKPLNYFCAGQCKSLQTFEIFDIDNGKTDTYREDLRVYAAAASVGRGVSPTGVGDNTYHVTIRCLMCKAYAAHFFISFNEIKKKGEVVNTVIQKVGQLPSIESTVDPAIEKWLSKKDLGIYKKGLRCESNNFGIGAFSYFRRVVEDNVEKILNDIHDTTDNEELREAITEAKKQHNATSRLEIIKDHAPQSFMAEGQNVFTIIYSALSEGMHAKTDEECLTAASNIRVCLAFLVKKIAIAREESAELKLAITSLVNG